MLDFQDNGIHFVQVTNKMTSYHRISTAHWYGITYLASPRSHVILSEVNRGKLQVRKIATRLTYECC